MYSLHICSRSKVRVLVRPPDKQLRILYNSNPSKRTVGERETLGKVSRETNRSDLFSIKLPGFITPAVKSRSGLPREQITCSIDSNPLALHPGDKLGDCGVAELRRDGEIMLQDIVDRSETMANDARDLRQRCPGAGKPRYGRIPEILVALFRQRRHRRDMPDVGIGVRGCVLH